MTFYDVYYFVTCLFRLTVLLLLIIILGFVALSLFLYIIEPDDVICPVIESNSLVDKTHTISQPTIIPQIPTLPTINKRGKPINTSLSKQIMGTVNISDIPPQPWSP